MAVYIKKLVVTFSRTAFNIKYTGIRNMSGVENDVSGKALLYQEYGDPVKVLSVKTQKVDKPENKQVSVKWLLAPVNPADINTIQGKYPSRPSLPAVAGNEGVGEIVALGPNVQNLHVGDRVVPNAANLGTWRTRATYNSDDLLKMPKEIGTVEASMINVNPCTAYRMLKDFVTLMPGDTVIQNGGNSAVGQIVIQLCKAWGINSVNIVRDRPDIAELKDQLVQLGATKVLTEAELRTTDIFKSKQLIRPKLALNCISGQNALEVFRQLDHNGVMVTYGGMSREPLTVPTSSLIFKNLSLKGFWMTAWSKTHMDSKERVDMYNDLTQLFQDKKLQAPKFKLIPFNKFEEALLNTLNSNGKTGLKYILDMTKSNL